MIRTVLIDFDNTLHSYTSGWQGAPNIPDAPHPGAIDWLRELIEDPEIEPVILTTRVHCGENDDPMPAESAKGAIRGWLYIHGMSVDEVEQLKITDQKVPAAMLVDDRAFQFRGEFPSTDFIKTFKPHPVKNLSPLEEELRSKLQYLVDYVSLAEEEGGFTFPDGDFWPETPSTLSEEEPQ